MFCVVIRVERHDEYDTGNMTAHGVECNTVENAKVLCETNKGKESIFWLIFSEKFPVVIVLSKYPNSHAMFFWCYGGFLG